MITQIETPKETPQAIADRFFKKPLKDYGIPPLFIEDSEKPIISDNATLQDVMMMLKDGKEPLQNINARQRRVSEEVLRIFHFVNDGKTVNAEVLRLAARSVRTLCEELRINASLWDKWETSASRAGGKNSYVKNAVGNAIESLAKETSRAAVGSVALEQTYDSFYAAIYTAVYEELQALGRCQNLSFPNLKNKEVKEI